MYSVYVLRSQRNRKRYIGYTSKNPKVRLKEHNSGANKWTNQNGPFELIYTEEFNNKKDAIAREKFLKSGQGRKFLEINSPLPPKADQPLAEAQSVPACRQAGSRWQLD